MMLILSKELKDLLLARPEWKASHLDSAAISLDVWARGRLHELQGSHALGDLVNRAVDITPATRVQ